MPPSLVQHQGWPSRGSLQSLPEVLICIWKGNPGRVNASPEEVQGGEWGVEGGWGSWGGWGEMVVLQGGKSTVCPMLQLAILGPGHPVLGLWARQPQMGLGLETVKLDAFSAVGQEGTPFLPLPQTLACENPPLPDHAFEAGSNKTTTTSYPTDGCLLPV